MPIDRGGEEVGVTTAGVIVRAGGEGQTLRPLCGCIVPDEIIGKAPLGGHFNAVEAGLLGKVEPADRLERLIRAQHRNTHPRADSGGAGCDLLCAREKADRRVGIAQFERGAAGIAATTYIARIAGQTSPCSAQQPPRARPDRMSDGPRGRGTNAA